MEGEYHNRDEQINAIVNLAVLSGIVTTSFVSTGVFSAQVGVALTAASGGLASAIGIAGILVGFSLATTGVAYGTHALSNIILAIDLIAEGEPFVIEAIEPFNDKLYIVKPLN